MRRRGGPGSGSLGAVQVGILRARSSESRRRLPGLPRSRAGSRTTGLLIAYKFLEVAQSVVPRRTTAQSLGRSERARVQSEFMARRYKIKITRGIGNSCGSGVWGPARGDLR